MLKVDLSPTQTFNCASALSRREILCRIDRSETFDDFLADEDLLEDAENAALKQIIADQVKAAMEAKRITKTAMAARMKTSRRQLDRLLDPANDSVTLSTLKRAASAVGRRLAVTLE